MVSARVGRSKCPSVNPAERDFLGTDVMGGNQEAAFEIVSVSDAGDLKRLQVCTDARKTAQRAMQHRLARRGKNFVPILIQQTLAIAQEFSDCLFAQEDTESEDRENDGAFGLPEWSRRFSSLDGILIEAVQRSDRPFNPAEPLGFVFAHRSEKRPSTLHIWLAGVGRDYRRQGLYMCLIVTHCFRWTDDDEWRTAIAPI